MSGTTAEVHAADLAGYDTSKGTVRLPPDQPPPAALARKPLKARLAENAARREARRAAPSRKTPRSGTWRGLQSTFMTVQTFRDLLTRCPFQPFRLVISSGQSYDVRHPEMTLLTRTDLLVGVDEADDGVPASFKICSLLHVTAVEPIGAEPQTA